MAYFLCYILRTRFRCLQSSCFWVGSGVKIDFVQMLGNQGQGQWGCNPAPSSMSSVLCRKISCHRRRCAKFLNLLVLDLLPFLLRMQGRPEDRGPATGNLAAMGIPSTPPPHPHFSCHYCFLLCHPSDGAGQDEKLVPHLNLAP